MNLYLEICFYRHRLQIIKKSFFLNNVCLRLNCVIVKALLCTMEFVICIKIYLENYYLIFTVKIAYIFFFIHNDSLYKPSKLLFEHVLVRLIFYEPLQAFITNQWCGIVYVCIAYCTMQFYTIPFWRNFQCLPCFRWTLLSYSSDVFLLETYIYYIHICICEIVSCFLSNIISMPSITDFRFTSDINI